MAGQAPRSPLDELRSTMQRLNRFIDRSGPDFHPLWESDEGLLPVDIEQRDDELVVVASLPGFSKEEVHVHLHQGVLSIEAAHAEAVEDHSRRFYRRERYHGPVSRRLALPGVIDDPDVTAVFRDGVLTLHIHVMEEHRPRQVTIAGA